MDSKIDTKEFFQQDKFADVIFKIGDEETKCHRYIPHLVEAEKYAASSTIAQVSVFSAYFAHIRNCSEASRYLLKALCVATTGCHE